MADDGLQTPIAYGAVAAGKLQYLQTLGEKLGVKVPLIDSDHKGIPA